MPGRLSRAFESADHEVLTYAFAREAQNPTISGGNSRRDVAAWDQRPKDAPGTRLSRRIGALGERRPDRGHRTVLANDERRACPRRAALPPAPEHRGVGATSSTPAGSARTARSRVAAGS